MTDTCCGDQSASNPSQVTRRSVLQGFAAVSGGVVGASLLGESLLQASFAGSPGGNALVVISLRGGIDGLGVVVPHSDPNYYRLRPTIAPPVGALICKDSTFGLHPAAAPLARYWQSGELAFVNAVGLPTPNRSHFAAIEEIEEAAPGSGARSGWINRMVGLDVSPSPIAGVQLGTSAPSTAMSGAETVLAAPSLTRLTVPGLDSDGNTRRYRSLESAWATTPTFGRGVRDAITVSRTVGTRLSELPRGTASYPDEWNAKPYAEPLRNAAQLLRADVGADVVTIDAGNWDMHSNYGTVTSGPMTWALDGLSRSVAAFLDDLGQLRDRVTVVTISEFGRRLQENGSRGLDHGWGNMMMVAGAGVRGGQFHGRWPGLNADSLTDGELRVTTDYRDVIAEVVAARFPDRDLSAVFPGFRRTQVGVMA